MNRPQCVVATLVLTFGFWCAGVRGEAGGAAPMMLPQEVYTAPAGKRAAIDDFVEKNVAGLLNDSDFGGQGRSRDALVSATMTQGAPATPEFLLEFGQALNKSLETRFAPGNKLSLRQRLNAAIVTAKVATVAQNTTLRPMTMKLLDDPAEAVVLWGLKAAQPQVPVLMKMRAGAALPPLVAAIAPAVLKHPSGPMFEEAYTALNTTDPQVVGELMKLWGDRLSQYQGKDFPDEPAVDGKPVFMLTTGEMWKSVLAAPAKQLEVMQMISDQLSVAAQWADAPNTSPDKRDQLARLAKQCADGCYVVGTNQKLPALQAAALSAGRLDPKALPPGAKIMPVVAPLLKEIPIAFPGVKPAPNVVNGNGAPAEVAKP